MATCRGASKRAGAGRKAAPAKSRTLIAEAQRLLDLPAAAQAKSDDARFGAIIQDVHAEAISAKDLAERVLAQPQKVSDPRLAVQRLRQLREKIVSLPKATLEEELRQIFAPSPQLRNQRIVIEYFGWDDGKQHTLAEVGARYEMTRERTRQICAKTTRRQKPAAILAPVLDRTLALIKRKLPGSVEGLKRELIQEGLTSVGLGLDHIAAAAKLLHRPAPFRVVPIGDGSLAVRPGQEVSPPFVAEVARKEVYYHGLSTLDAICRHAGEKLGGPIERPLVAEVLQVLDGFCWLDPDDGWFTLRAIRKHGLPRAIDKILSVAGPIRLPDLRAAIGRSRRLGAVAPPEHVLREFCRASDGIAVQGDRVSAKPRQPWQKVLNGVELQLAEILTEHGPVLERGVLEDLAVQRGMNRFSFHAFVASSPIIAQFGHGVYGLLGAKVPEKSIQALVARRRADREPTRVLDSHGVNEDGTLWLAYQLSKAASTYAVVTVPAALKTAIRGSFRLLADGREVGTLAAKDGRAWGLGAFLRQQDAHAGDRAVLTLDLDARTAIISLDRQKR